jgi:hypothetical protein
MAQLIEDQDEKVEAQPKEESKEAPESTSKFVKEWIKKIKDAKQKRFNNDFDRMRDNMDFVTGIQWNGQQGITFNKTVVNLTLQAVNHNVAMLYARDPQFEARPVKRLNYQMWDGNVQTIQQAQMLVQMAQMDPRLALMLPPDVPAMLADFQRGRMHEMLVQKVCDTWNVLFRYQIANQYPCFKTQMKQLVRRVNVCGVGYIKVLFCRDYDQELTQSETRLSVMDRAKVAKFLVEKLEKGDIDENSAEVDRLKTLVNSLGGAILDQESVQVKERITFDFPRSTSIIPDPETRTLKGFVGARWIAEEFYYSLEFVNAFFEKDIKPDTELKLFSTRKTEETTTPELHDDIKKQMKKKVRLWEVYDLDTKSTFIICDGYKDFVQAPEAVAATKGFWNIVPVTFNDIEVEDECKATIFPPSLVDLIKPQQKEWNRMKQAIRRHRIASAPRYLYPDGQVDTEDLDKIVDSEDQEFIPLKSLQPGVDPSKVVVPLGVVDVKKELYDTSTVSEDVLINRETGDRHWTCSAKCHSNQHNDL